MVLLPCGILKKKVKFFKNKVVDRGREMLVKGVHVQLQDE